MATKGYQSYHGRMPGWKKLLIGILLLILIAAVGFLFLQNYQVFDQDGAHFRLPWAGQTQADPSAEEELDDDDVIVDVQEPASVLEELRGRTLPAETLAEEDFASLQEGPSWPVRKPPEAWCAKRSPGGMPWRGSPALPTRSRPTRKTAWL